MLGCFIRMCLLPVVLLLVLLPTSVNAQRIKKHKKTYPFKYDIRVPVDSAWYKLDSITAYSDSSMVHLRFTLKTKSGEAYCGGSIAVENKAASSTELDSNGLYVLKTPSNTQTGMPGFNCVFEADFKPPVSCIELSGWQINLFSLCGIEFKPGQSYHFLINVQRRDLPLYATLHSSKVLAKSEIDTIINDLYNGVEPDLIKQNVCYMLIWI